MSLNEVNSEMIFHGEIKSTSSCSQRVGRMWQSLTESKYFWIALIILGGIGLGCAVYGSTVLILNHATALQHTFEIILTAVGGCASLIGIVAVAMLIKRCLENRTEKNEPIVKKAETIEPKIEAVKEKETTVPQNENVKSNAETETTEPTHSTQTKKSLYTEQEVIDIVGKAPIEQWKEEKLMDGFYHSFYDHDKQIYGIRFPRDGEEKVVYHASLSNYHAAAKILVEKYQLIDQWKLRWHLNRTTGSNYLHVEQLKEYKLNEWYYWPFELTISNQKLYLLEDFYWHTACTWRTAAERFECMHKRQYPENYRAQELAKLYDLETKLGEKDYACFTQPHWYYDLLVFYKLNGKLTYTEVYTEQLEEFKQKEGLTTDRFGKIMPMETYIRSHNGYAKKLRVDHKLKEKIKTEQDYAAFSEDGACVYLFTRREGKFRSDLIAVADLQKTLGELGLTNNVLKS